MLRNIWNHRLKGSICLHLVFADPNQPVPVTTKTVALVSRRFPERRTSVSDISPLTAALENRFSLPGGALSFYLLTRRILCPSTWVVGIILKHVVLPASGVIWNGKRRDYSNFSVPRDGTQCPVLWLQTAACCWKARMFNRPRPGEKCPAFHLFYSCEVPHTACHSFHNVAILMIKMLRRGCQNVTQNQLRHSAWHSKY